MVAWCRAVRLHTCAQAEAAGALLAVNLMTGPGFQQAEQMAAPGTVHGPVVGVRLGEDGQAEVGWSACVCQTLVDGGGGARVHGGAAWVGGAWVGGG